MQEGLSRTQAWHLHWMKELKTPQERREAYTLLRSIDVPPSVANRVKDWSQPHIDSFIESWLTYEVPRRVEEDK